MILFISIVSVAASDVNETQLSNQDNNSLLESSQEEIIGDMNDGTFTSLQNKINNASDGSTIALDRDYTYDEGFHEIGIVINKNLTIDGKGHTLDGKSKSRIFMTLFGVDNHNKVTLKNINFVNGHTKYYGGAILNFANLTVNKCSFTNNYAYYCGGAINSVGYLDCRNSNFNKNVADGDGGAIFSLSFENSVKFYHDFYLNRTVDGKLEFMPTITMDVTLKSLTDKVTGCVFKNNVAKGRGGGAIYAFSNINIASSTFTLNKAGEKGGAVFANKDVFIKNSKFTSNTAQKYGGAVYFKCHESSGHYDSKGKWISEIKYYDNLIQKSTFAKNTASKGGAIYGFRTSSSDKIHCVKAVKCTFTNNKASTSGRDIYGGTTSNCVFNYLKLALNSVNVKKSAGKLVLTAKLTKGKSLIKGKTIAFKFNGKIYKAKTNSKGIAKVTITKNILKKLEVGKTIKYLAKYCKLTVIKSAKVKK
ncbi:MAG: hypothetical protein Q4Q55_04200 [Methanobrevibacter sp.]|nr:hypothetical protein [Methanobrevibacter sp.]